MKANELMVGDWVKARLFGKEAWLTLQVRALGGGINLEYEPIPLSDDILKANGFVTDNDHTLTGSCIYHRLCGKYEDYKITVRLLNGWIKIESFDDRWYTLLNLAIQPRYVHELQHALRLCGLNDLADDFIVEVE